MRPPETRTDMCDRACRPVQSTRTTSRITSAGGACARAGTQQIRKTSIPNDTLLIPVVTRSGAQGSIQAVNEEPNERGEWPADVPVGSAGAGNAVARGLPLHAA